MQINQVHQPATAPQRMERTLGFIPKVGFKETEIYYGDSSVPSSNRTHQQYNSISLENKQQSTLLEQPQPSTVSSFASTTNEKPDDSSHTAANIIDIDNNNKIGGLGVGPDPLGKNLTYKNPTVNIPQVSVSPVETVFNPSIKNLEQIKYEFSNPVESHLVHKQWRNFVNHAWHGSQSCVIHHVYFPPGVTFDHPGLATAEIISERRYFLPAGKVPDATLNPAGTFQVFADPTTIPAAYPVSSRFFVDTPQPTHLFKKVVPESFNQQDHLRKASNGTYFTGEDIAIADSPLLHIVQ